MYLEQSRHKTVLRVGQNQVVVLTFQFIPEMDAARSILTMYELMSDDHWHFIPFKCNIKLDFELGTLFSCM